MALQMEYEDATGIVHPQSYWRVVCVNLCQADHTAQIIFYGYANKNCRDSGKGSIGKKIYPIYPPEYSQWFFVSELNPENKNPVERAYEYAKQKAEIVADEELASFFSAAIEA